MTNIKKIFLLVLIFSVSNAYSIGRINKIKEARDMIQSGSINSDDTCLDEYLYAQNQLKYMLGLGPLGAGLVNGAAGAVTLGAIAGISAIGAGAAAGAAIAVPIAVGYGAYSLTKLLQTNYIIKVLSDTHNGKGKSLNKFSKKFLRRHKEARGYMTREHMKETILELDRSGALCDGSLKKVRRIKFKAKIPRRRHQLALKRDIYRYINSTL
jgi:stage V sporulation protein SpoVS